MSIRILALCAIAVFCAVPALAQESEHEGHHPEGQQESAAPEATEGNMPEMCRMMQDRMEQMHGKMMQMQAELDAAVSEMNAAEGDAREETMMHAINEMCETQKAMHEAHANMMMGMMKHMSEHMAQDMDKPAKKEMMKCPMMGEMMKGGMKGEGSESKTDADAPEAEEDHSAHH